METIELVKQEADDRINTLIEQRNYNADRWAIAGAELRAAQRRIVELEAKLKAAEEATKGDFPKTNGSHPANPYGGEHHIHEPDA